MLRESEVREMRTAEAILNIIRDRGQRGLPIEDLYRQLFKPALFQMAYGKIYANQGAMTPGATSETVDGMSQDKIARIIELLRQEKYHWTPVRRTHIEKKHSTKKRPLGLPTWSDKLVQEVIRLILEAYYEPQFASSSHGFRPGLGCHTALRHIEYAWHGTTWFIEGDISKCFDNLDHQVLLSILKEKIHDNRFIRLIENCLKAGYLEQWTYHATLSGTPQGGIISPILANIYMDRLDQFVEHILYPDYNRGERRTKNPEYSHLLYAKRTARRQGLMEDLRSLDREMHQIPSVVVDDPNYRRLRYVRYADDFLLGFAGPKVEAEEIKRRIGVFLRETLRLEMSDTKTLITHAQTQAARFLGYDLTVFHEDRHRDRNNGRRAINGKVGLSVPEEVVRERCERYLRHGKATHLTQYLYDDDFSIVATFQAEYRGFANYYQLAYNRSGRLKRLKWLMEWSLTKTLAAKYHTSIQKIYRRYQTTIETREGKFKVLQVVVSREGRKPLIATWGGISLARPKGPVILVDRPEPHLSGLKNPNELLKRLLADQCERCGSCEQVEVHHIHALRDLKPKGKASAPWWVVLMAQRRRKTLVLCHNCHALVHAGKMDSNAKSSHGRAG